MGVTVNEPYMTHAGFEVPSHYISLGDSQIQVFRPPVMPTPIQEGEEAPPPAQKYAIETHFNIWVSKTARDESRSKIGLKRVQIISETPITENVYTVLYNKLKEDLTNYTEDI
jgi:hypothetical protein